MDPITQRLTTLVQKAGADGKFSFFERRGIKKALSAAIESAPSVAKVDEYCDAVRKEVGSAGWGLHDFPSSWTYRRTTKLADARSRMGGEIQAGLDWLASIGAETLLAGTPATLVAAPVARH